MVKGDKIHNLYSWLTKKSLNGVLDASITWNFNKFLVSEKGNLLAYYPSGVKPDDAELIAKIEAVMD